MPLCDLLPTAYASLLYSLNVINTNKYFPDAEIDDCPSVMQIVKKDSQLCSSLPGLPLWSMINNLQIYFRRIEKRVKFFVTVAPDYNREHFFVRQHDLDQYITELRQIKSEFANRRRTLEEQLNLLYDADVTDEWVELYVKPLSKQIDTIFSQFSALTEQKIWPRRPLH